MCASLTRSQRANTVLVKLGSHAVLLESSQWAFAGFDRNSGVDLPFVPRRKSKDQLSEWNMLIMTKSADVIGLQLTMLKRSIVYYCPNITS